MASGGREIILRSQVIIARVQRSEAFFVVDTDVFSGLRLPSLDPVSRPERDPQRLSGRTTAMSDVGLPGQSSDGLRSACQDDSGEVSVKRKEEAFFPPICGSEASESGNRCERGANGEIRWRAGENLQTYSVRRLGGDAANRAEVAVPFHRGQLHVTDPALGQLSGPLHYASSNGVRRRTREALSPVLEFTCERGECVTSPGGNRGTVTHARDVEG